MYSTETEQKFMPPVPDAVIAAGLRPSYPIFTQTVNPNASKFTPDQVMEGLLKLGVRLYSKQRTVFIPQLPDDKHSLKLGYPFRNKNLREIEKISTIELIHYLVGVAFEDDHLFPNGHKERTNFKKQLEDNLGPEYRDCSYFEDNQLRGNVIHRVVTAIGSLSDLAEQRECFTVAGELHQISCEIVKAIKPRVGRGYNEMNFLERIEVVQEVVDRDVEALRLLYPGRPLQPTSVT